MIAQECSHNSSHTENAVRPKNVNPLKIDPSRTGMLRRRFEASVTRRFKQIKRAVRKLIVDEDVFGLKRQNHSVDNSSQNVATQNTRWQFQSSPEKAKSFQAWLETQVELTGVASEAEDAYYKAYIDQGYKKGIERAFDDNRKVALQSGVSDFYEGTKQEFLSSAFNNPQSLEKVKLLASRTLTDLKNVTTAMSTQMSRTLLDGFTRGDGPLAIAGRMAKDIDGIGIVRARTIARTEIIRAHAEGQLDSLERQGAEKVGVMVEWSATGGYRMCERCGALMVWC